MFASKMIFNLLKGLEDFFDQSGRNTNPAIAYRKHQISVLVKH